MEPSGLRSMKSRFMTCHSRSALSGHSAIMQGMQPASPSTELNVGARKPSRSNVRQTTRPSACVNSSSNERSTRSRICSHLFSAQAIVELIAVKPLKLQGEE